MSPRLLLAMILGFPIAELLSVLIMADLFGALVTFLLLAAGAVAGVYVLKSAGRTAIAELRRRAGSGRVDSAVLGRMPRLALVGVLLIIPGFVSDLMALALSLPALRERLVKVVRSGAVGAEEPRARRPVIIELDRSDYRPLDDSRR